MTADGRLVSERFPRSSKYHPEWVIARGLDRPGPPRQRDQESLALLTQRRRSVQAKLDRGYDDYLERRISDGFCTRKAESGNPS
jgi:hypothetical protein